MRTSRSARFLEQFLVLAVALTALLIASHARSTSFNNYIRVADGWLHGHMWIDYPGKWMDAAEYRGHWYTVDAPFPALLALPLVAIWGASTNQTTIAIGVALLAVYLAHALLFRLEVALLPRLALIAFLFAGTDLLWCAELGDVWLLAHLCAVAAIVGALLECTEKRRGEIVGLWLLAAIFSRNGEVFALVLVPWLLVSGDLGRTPDTRWRFGELGPLATILALGTLLWFAYNNAMWGGAFDIGHSLYYHADAYGQKTGSPFRLSYVPYQLYSFFVRGPSFVEWLQLPQWPYLKVDMSGVALTFTSPALVLAVLARRPFRLVALLWLTAFLVAVPDLLYYLNGWYQFGMRHALDFEPYLFVLMALAVRQRMPLWGYALCTWSVLFSSWGVWWWNTFVRTGS